MNTITKIIILLYASIALVGQAWAYASMSCDMSLHNDARKVSHAHHDMHKNNMAEMHSHHQEMTTDTHHAGQAECCISDCQCVSAGCYSAAFLDNHTEKPEHNYATERLIANDPFFASIPLTSLFRPPIFA